jgi:hypothetical protein
MFNAVRRGSVRKRYPPISGRMASSGDPCRSACYRGRTTGRRGTAGRLVSSPARNRGVPLRPRLMKHPYRRAAARRFEIFGRLPLRACRPVPGRPSHETRAIAVDELAQKSVPVQLLDIRAIDVVRAGVVRDMPNVVDVGERIHGPFRGVSRSSRHRAGRSGPFRGAAS